MSLKSEFGGLFSCLNKRDMEKFESVIGNRHEIYFEEFSIGSVYELSLQNILAIVTMETGPDVRLPIPTKTHRSNRPMEEQIEMLRQSREDRAFFNRIKKKVLVYGKIHDTGIYYLDSQGGDNLGPVYKTEGPTLPGKWAFLEELLVEEETSDC